MKVSNESKSDGVENRDPRSEMMKDCDSRSESGGRKQKSKSRSPKRWKVSVAWLRISLSVGFVKLLFIIYYLFVRLSEENDDDGRNRR